MENTNYSSNNDGKKIVRILGVGQFTIDKNTLHEINIVDNELVKLLEDQNQNITTKLKFQEHVLKLNELIEKKGKILDAAEIVESDYVLPNKDISLEEAKKIFKGEGIIHDTD